MRTALFGSITQRVVVNPHQKIAVFICFATEAWNHTWGGSNQVSSSSVCSLKCSSFCSFTKRKTVGNNGSVMETEVPAATTTVVPPYSVKPLISLIVSRRCLASPSFVYVVSCLFCLFVSILMALDSCRCCSVCHCIFLVACHSINAVDAVYDYV
jgi:hypothetical protein